MKLSGPKTNKPLISRPVAQAAGLLRYNTGETCIRGHVNERLVSNRTCVTCHNLKAGSPYQLKVRRVRGQRWRDANRDNIQCRNKAWEKANREVRRLLTANRRARKKTAKGKFQHSDIVELLIRQRYLCANPYCVKNIAGCYTIDHKTPLTRGGSNWPRNLQLLCSPCNSSKWTKTQSEWLRSLRRKQ